jgi:hypothetical protein
MPAQNDRVALARRLDIDGARRRAVCLTADTDGAIWL